MARILAAFVTLALLLVSGCVSPFRGPGGSGSTGTTSTGKLYVATPNSILRFGSALTASGNVAPEATITGAATQLSSPQHIFVDTGSDRLFVANQGGPSVLIFASASTMTGNVVPSAVLTSTGNIASPVDVAVDTTNNLLYVADGQNLLVFSGESTLSGTQNTPPVRTVNFTFAIGAIFLDTANNRLFIADPADNAVEVLLGASTANGPGATLATPIVGSATLLSVPSGMTLDGGGRLIVSNAGSPASITIYSSTNVSNAGSAPNIPPAAVITGSATKLASPGEMAFNTGAGTSGELYVADALAPGIITYLNVGAASGTINLVPNRLIQGSGTTFAANGVKGMALDTTH